MNKVNVLLMTEVLQCCSSNEHVEQYSKVKHLETHNLMPEMLLCFT